MDSTYDEDHFLHWSFGSAHVLFPALRIDSLGTFLASSILVTAICFSERFLSYVSEQQWRPHFLSGSHWKLALWKSSLYWLTTLLRLLYMLCAMSFHAGLLLVIVTSLAIAHFLVELRKEIRLGSSRGQYSSIEERALLNDTPHTRTPSSRPRSKSKPEGIFIHPRDSNLARADAAALQLGIAGATERVSGSVYEMKKEAPWEAGTGRDAARALLGSNTRRDSERRAFNIGSDSDSSDCEM